MINGLDVSTYNNYTPGGEDFVMIKMGGGDAGMYLDSKAALNYSRAKNAGKAVGGYWFAGGTDPVAEADYFLRCMSPLAENDVYALDWEIQHTNPVAWVQAFVNEIHSKIGVWCLVYLNISTTNAYDWTPVLDTCGLWLAAPSYPFTSNAPVSHTYVMQQGAIVNGIDSDAFFGDVAQFNAYGYHAPTAAPTPTPTPQPVSEPVSAPTPVVEPTTTVTTSPPVTTQTNITQSSASPVAPSTVEHTSTFSPKTPPPNSTQSNWWPVSFFQAILRFLHFRV